MSNSNPGSGFDVSPELMTAGAGTFEAEAAALQQAVTALGTRLSADGACWGTDAEGAKFASTYQPAAAQIQSDLSDLVAGMERIAAALRASAAAYAAADQASVPSPASTTTPTPTAAPTTTSYPDPGSTFAPATTPLTVSGSALPISGAQ